MKLITDQTEELTKYPRSAPLIISITKPSRLGKCLEGRVLEQSWGRSEIIIYVDIVQTVQIVQFYHL